MLNALINALIGDVVVDIEVAVKLEDTPSSNVMAVLGSDGRSYTLKFRKKFRNGTFSSWSPVQFGN